MAHLPSHCQGIPDCPEFIGQLIGKQARYPDPKTDSAFKVTIIMVLKVISSLGSLSSFLWSSHWTFLQQITAEMTWEARTKSFSFQYMHFWSLRWRAGRTALCGELSQALWAASLSCVFLSRPFQRRHSHLKHTDSEWVDIPQLSLIILSLLHFPPKEGSFFGPLWPSEE